GEGGVGGVPGAPAGESARGGLPGHAGSQRRPRAGGGAGFRWGRRSAVGPSLESIRAEEAVVTRWVLLGVALGLACQPSAADHEELGDRAYAAGAYRDALAEYELGLKAHPGSADLNAKAGAAALHLGDFASAVDAYVVLGARDGSRAGEAADGLERVARAALAANDRGDAAKGLAGLRAVAPTRPLGRYTRLAALDAADRGDTASAIVLLPGAIAAAGDARMADSLLFVYGMAAVRARDCATAVPAFEGVIRRQREPAVADRAREGLGLCSLVEGQQLLEKGKPSKATDWFRRATAPGSPADDVRGALPAPDPVAALAKARAQFRSGDYSKALLSFRRLTYELGPSQPEMAEARYHMAECYFQTGDRVQAAHEFRQVADQFATSEYAPLALLRAGDANLRLWRKPELDPSYGETALAIYQELAGRYPGTDAAARAQMHTQQLKEWFSQKDYKNGMFYFRRRAYDSAIIYFKDVIATYPGT